MSKLITRPGEPGYIYPGSKEYSTVLGCSEVAAVLGFDQFGKTNKDVWLKKTHRAPDTEHKRIFDRGHAMEPLMASMMKVDHGRTVKCDQVQYRHPEYPWLIYHCDGMFSRWTPLNRGAKPQEGPGIWEAKAPGSHITAQFQKDGMSDGYVCQTQTGMFVAAAALGIPIGWGTAGFLDYDEYETVPFDLVASPKFQNDTIITLAEFWECVESDTPPSPINPSQHERPPSIEGDLKIIDDNEELRQLAFDLAALIGPMKQAEDSNDQIRERMKEILNPYSCAEVPDVMKFTYGYGKAKEKIDGAGLLAYCEHLCYIYDTTFRREDWVTPVAPTRSFRPTIIERD